MVNFISYLNKTETLDRELIKKYNQMTEEAERRKKMMNWVQGELNKLQDTDLNDREKLDLINSLCASWIENNKNKTNASNE